MECQLLQANTTTLSSPRAHGLLIFPQRSLCRLQTQWQEESSQPDLLPAGEAARWTQGPTYKDEAATTTSGITSDASSRVKEAGECQLICRDRSRKETNATTNALSNVRGASQHMQKKHVRSESIGKHIPSSKAPQVPFLKPGERHLLPKTACQKTKCGNFSMHED